MNDFLYKILIISILSVLGSIAHGQEREVVKEKTILAGDWDSRMSCRERASNELKLELLNEVGSYIEQEMNISSKESVEGFHQSFQERIFTITAGIAKYKILEEKWNGERYWVRSVLSYNPNEVSEQLSKRIENHELIKENEFLYDTLSRFKKDLTVIRKKVELIESQVKKDSASSHFNRKWAFKRLEGGNEKFREGELENAIQDYSKAIELFKRSDNEALRVDILAECYIQRGKAKSKLSLTQEAVQDFLMAASNSKAYRSRAYWMVGEEYISQDRKDLSVFYITKAIEAAPLNPKYYEVRSWAYLPDHPSLALRDLESARELGSKEGVGFYNKLVLALIMTDKIHRASVEVDQGLRIDPNNELLTYRKIQILNQKEEYRKTLEFFRKLNLVNPKDADMLMEVAKAYCMEGQKTKCKQYYEAAIHYSTSYVDRIQLRYSSDLIFQFEDLEGALSVLRSMQTPTNDNRRSWYYQNYVFAALYSKSYAECVRVGERAMHYDPSNHLVAKTVGLAHFHLSNFGKANEIISRVISSDNNSARDGYLFQVRALCKWKTGGGQWDICSDLNQAVKLGYEPARDIYRSYCN